MTSDEDGGGDPHKHVSITMDRGEWGLVADACDEMCNYLEVGDYLEQSEAGQYDALAEKIRSEADVK